MKNSFTRERERERERERKKERERRNLKGSKTQTLSYPLLPVSAVDESAVLLSLGTQHDFKTVVSVDKRK